MKKIKIIFIGGLSNGKIVYDYLKNNKYVILQLVITYPDAYMAPRMISIGHPNAIKTTSANSQIEKIKELKPDYIFVAGWSELLATELISMPTNGTIGFHPSKLPFDRGRSVVAWQIEEGYQDTALTMFYYNDVPDNGDIIAQECIVIEKNDYCDDILNKIDKATYNLMYAYFPLIRLGKAPRIKQKLEEGTFRRLRKEQDSQIEWNQNSINIYNKIRAISKPYSGAEAVINNQKMKIWKAIIVQEFFWGKDTSPGSIVAHLYDQTMIIKTKNGFIHILEYDIL
jgi:methionyl-tRNA formyltransferase